MRAKLRTTSKRLLAKHGYPPDAQPAAVQLVLRQMETFAEEWTPTPTVTHRASRADPSERHSAGQARSFEPSSACSNGEVAEYDDVADLPSLCKGQRMLGVLGELAGVHKAGGITVTDKERRDHKVDLVH